MKVLVACEFSGVVRDAFRARGHEAVSCDVLPCESDIPGWHIQDDVRKALRQEWDLMIAHPPCTHLCVSGARWFAGRQPEQQAALDFVARLMCAPIPRIAIENPVSVISSWIRKPDQIIQPFEYGHPESKATCLWLKGLPKLVPTNNVKASMDKLPKSVTDRIHRASPGPDRWKERSRTLPGIAEAMATQWNFA